MPLLPSSGHQSYKKKEQGLPSILTSVFHPISICKFYSKDGALAMGGGIGFGEAATEWSRDTSKMVPKFRAVVLTLFPLIQFVY